MNWKLVYETKLNELGKVGLEFPWENEGAYSCWLGQTYHFVQNSTRILALASARAPEGQKDAHHRFIDHAKEERGHDVMLLNDLKFLNKSITDFPEFSATAALYQTQYYWIEHRSTDIFWGWVIALESFAANYGPAILERVVTSHGRQASTFLKIHSQEDQDHIEKAFLQIKKLSPEFEKEIVANFTYTIDYYKQILEKSALYASLNHNNRAAA